MTNYTTYAEFDSLCQKLAGINPSQIQTSVRQRIINDFIFQIYGLMDGSNSPFWNKIIDLTVTLLSAPLGTNYVKEIIKVYDDQGVSFAGASGQERVFNTDHDSKQFGQRDNDPLSVGDVFVYHSGNSIKFFVGSSATALGTVKALVVAKPTVFADGTKNDLCDCPPEENGALRDSVVAEFMKATGQQVPMDIGRSAQALQERVAAAQADRISAMRTKGKAD